MKVKKPHTFCGGLGGFGSSLGLPGHVDVLLRGLQQARLLNPLVMAARVGVTHTRACVLCVCWMHRDVFASVTEQAQLHMAEAPTRQTASFFTISRLRVRGNLVFRSTDFAFAALASCRPATRGK